MDGLVELLDAAERGRWPAQGEEAAWLQLATWAFQTECLMADETENTAWEDQMRVLLRRELPYAAFVAARMAALNVRLRVRKLNQTNLRYRYGFKPRSASLVRRDVKRFYRRWSEG
jgi:hypothetical protein